MHRFAYPRRDNSGCVSLRATYLLCISACFFFFSFSKLNIYDILFREETHYDNGMEDIDAFKAVAFSFVLLRNHCFKHLNSGKRQKLTNK